MVRHEVYECGMSMSMIAAAYMARFQEGTRVQRIARANSDSHSPQGQRCKEMSMKTGLQLYTHDQK